MNNKIGNISYTRQEYKGLSEMKKNEFLESLSAFDRDFASSFGKDEQSIFKSPDAIRTSNNEIDINNIDEDKTQKLYDIAVATDILNTDSQDMSDELTGNEVGTIKTIYSKIKNGEELTEPEKNIIDVAYLLRVSKEETDIDKKTLLNNIKSDNLKKEIKKLKENNIYSSRDILLALVNDTKSEISKDEKKKLENQEVIKDTDGNLVEKSLKPLLGKYYKNKEDISINYSDRPKEEGGF